MGIAPDERGGLGPLDHLSFDQVLSVTPTSEVDQRFRTVDRSRIGFGLLDAAIRGDTVASLWCRRQPGGPLKVFMAGSAALHRADHPVNQPNEEPLSFPLGSSGRRTSPSEVPKLLREFDIWKACQGEGEPLLHDENERFRRTDEYNGHLFDEAIA